MSNELIATSASAPLEDVASSNANTGNRFSHSTAVIIDHIGYYRKTVGKCQVAAVDLWDTTGPAHLARSVPTAFTDDGSVGWHYIPIVAHTLSAGHDYVVSVAVVTGDGPTYWASSPPSIGAGYSLTGVRYNNAGNADTNYPSTVSGAELAAVSVATLATSAPPEGAADLAAIDADIASWQSTDADVQQHEADGIPWLLKTELAATKLLVEGVLDNFRDADGNLRSIGDFSKAMTPTLVAIVQTFFERADKQLTGATSEGGTAFASLQDRMNDLENQLDGLADLVTAAPVPFPGSGWAMADEVDFVQAKSWDVPADLYTLSTSSWPVNIRQVLVDGAPWRPRLGWWAPRNGDLIGARRFVDWEASILEDGGRRMPGIVVWLEPSTAGTLQAWVLT